MTQPKSKLKLKPKAAKPKAKSKFLPDRPMSRQAARDYLQKLKATCSPKERAAIVRMQRRHPELIDDAMHAMDRAMGLAPQLGFGGRRIEDQRRDR